MSTSATFAGRSSRIPPTRSSSSRCPASATASPAPANSANVALASAIKQLLERGVEAAPGTDGACCEPSGGSGARGRVQLAVNREQPVEVVREAEALDGAGTGAPAELAAEGGEFDQGAQRQP